MKTLTRILVIVQFIVSLCMPADAQFQPVEVKLSQEKTIVNGKIFYIHTVLKGQTLYSISKAYGVSQDEIIRNNTSIDFASLKEGQALKIPGNETKPAAIYPPNRDDYIAHKVKRSQTVYSVARKFKVDEEVIYQHNPWAREGIQPDQTLWIPRDREQPADVQSIPDESQYLYYTTKQKDTLYSISLAYGVTVSDIIENNPVLREGLKVGQVLKIPRVGTAVSGIEEDADTLQEETGPCMPADEATTYDIALLLPFFARHNMEEANLPVDTLVEEGTYVPAPKQQGLRGKSFVEFYEGFLLAVDSMKQTGLSVNLHVYDTERDSMKLKKIVRDLSVTQPDLVIGPVYNENVQTAGLLARYQEFNLVSPLSTRTSLVSGNSRIFQVVPSRESECKSLAAYLTQYRKGRVILVRGADSLSMVDSWRFKKHLSEHPLMDDNNMPLAFYNYRLNDSLLTNLGKILSQQEDNIIIVFSESEPDASRLISKLYMMSSLYPVKLFGMPSWQVWKTIDLTYFHHLQLQLITPFYTNYSSLQTRNFLNKCRMTYGYEPYEISPRGYNFGMLGYDLGLFFLSAIRQYGKDFQGCLNEVDADLLLSKYHFVRNGQGGYVNDSFSLIRYNPDFTIEKVVIPNDVPLY